MKKFISGILCAVIFLSILTACAGNSGTSGSSKAQNSAAVAKTNEQKLHTLTVCAAKDAGDITAVFLNTSTGKTAAVKMKKNGEQGSNNIFTCQGDVNLYNMVHVKFGEKSSMDVAFNSFISGWYLKKDELLPYITGKEPGYIYYDNSETKWDKVYAYWWGGLAFNSFTKEPYYFSEWPGFQMERIDNSDIYRIKAPWGNQGIIFDSGVTDREVSEGKEAFQTTDIPYNNDLIGKLYKIDMSVEPKADPGVMKSKRRYSAGNWSDYSAEK